MAVLEILQFPDPRLRTKATLVTDFDEVKRVLEDMFETMYAAHGVGLAATQVNIHKRFFTMDLSEEHNQPVCIINPEIISQEGTQFEGEGCLSVAGAYDKVKRAEKVHLRALDINGKEIEFHGDGLMAKCFQHEIDHLNGKLFLDHLSPLKQERLRKKIEKSQR